MFWKELDAPFLKVIRFSAELRQHIIRTSSAFLQETRRPQYHSEIALMNLSMLQTLPKHHVGLAMLMDGSSALQKVPCSYRMAGSCHLLYHHKHSQSTAC